MQPIAKGHVDKHPPPSSDDAEILKQISQGDVHHFETFVDRYKARLLAFVHHRIGDIHRAEDITQDVFLRAFRAARRSGYRGNDCAAAWLFSIARNCVTDYFRARSLDRTVFQSHQATGAHATESAPESQREQPEENESRTPIAAAGGMEAILGSLPEAQREVLVLRVFSEFTFAEIADAVGCKLPTVKSRMRYALEKVRELLIQAGSDDNE